jgi:glycosyltransferase involved in cell wall biosynthesis
MTVALRVGMVVPDLRVGGAERVLVDMVRSWHRDGERLEPYCYTFRDGPARAALAAHGCPVRVAPSARRVNPLHVPWLARQFRRDRIHLVHAHLPRAGVYARLAARLVDVPVVYTEHNMTSRYHALSGLLNRTTYFLNAHVVAVSGAVRASIGQSLLPPGRLTVVYNGVPPRDDIAGERQSTVRRELGLPLGEPVVGTIANLHPRKNIHHLLAAVHGLAARFPTLHCVFIGRDDGEGPRLQRIAAEAGIAARVHWLGFRPDARELLPALDVFVLPSLFEGLPVALIEAMDAGLPSIATRVGGNVEILTHGETGLLVEPGDVAGLAAALGALLADPNRRQWMGAAARQRARALFTVDRMARSYAALYRDVARI